MARQQQKQGKDGEKAAERELARLGVKNIAEIPTPKVLVRGKLQYRKKVLGDRRGELENGISVLAEIKTTMNKTRLSWSCFSKSKGETESQQPKNLDNHRGLSLLVWVCETDWSREIYVMDWIELKRYGFAPGQGIGAEDAEKLSMKESDFYFLASQVFHVSKDTVALF